MRSQAAQDEIQATQDSNIDISCPTCRAGIPKVNTGLVQSTIVFINFLQNDLPERLDSSTQDLTGDQMARPTGLSVLLIDDNIFAPIKIGIDYVRDMINTDDYEDRTKIDTLQTKLSSIQDAFDSVRHAMNTKKNGMYDRSLICKQLDNLRSLSSQSVADLKSALPYLYLGDK